MRLPRSSCALWRQALPNLEALDGFLTASVICPELIRPSEFVPFILSGRTEDDDLVLRNLLKRLKDFMAS